MKSEKVKANISATGFSKRELWGFRRIYKELKGTYHPNLTRELTLEEVIKEEARKAFALPKYFLLSIIITILGTLWFRNISYLFAPLVMMIIMILDIRSSAKNAHRKISSELKLMKLAFKLRL
ncbi:hypothetical protein PMPD1_0111 [Paramixta manurensis]|uniref:Uncharacterized protein n=1 Tax=Paramixta manurensis TaxID=2740817 RepID=A0A6M8U9E7_9GAMM|nr:hypothetical protein PMPD1_0111 [Erwiniaceae bacterium PD-1]